MNKYTPSKILLFAILSIISFMSYSADVNIEFQNSYYVGHIIAPQIKQQLRYQQKTVNYL